MGQRLGTPISGNLINCFGYVLGNVTGFGSGILTFLQTPSSANLRAALTDETGTGAAVFAQSPTLITPALGTPASGNLVNCTGYVNTSLTNSLSGDVNLNNTANYFDGPSVAQGTSGTWLVSGTVTVNDASTCSYVAKLWDGTTVIASTFVVIPSTETVGAISLSGLITSPAGNLRISVRNSTTTTGRIAFNLSGNSRDSTITAVRIG
jgi:hypothetical protein